MFSYERLSKKAITFQIIHWPDIYKNLMTFIDKEITKRYDKHEVQRLSKRKDSRERETGAVGRPFKLDVKNRFLMLLVYYRLYITYTLTGFLFDLDQGSLFQRHIQKIESLIRQCLPIPQKTYNNKEVKNSRRSKKYFPGFLAFIDSTEQQQIPRPNDNRRRKSFYSAKRKDTLLKIN